jgi:hypothetical protein
MLIGLLLPFLRRFGHRARMLIGVVIVAVGLALGLVVFALQGRPSAGGLHGHAVGADAPLIRIGLLLVIVGLGLLVSGFLGRHRGGRPVGGDPGQG